MGLSKRLEEYTDACAGGFADPGDWVGASNKTHLPDHSFGGCNCTQHRTNEIKRARKKRGSQNKYIRMSSPGYYSPPP